MPGIPVKIAPELRNPTHFAEDKFGIPELSNLRGLNDGVSEILRNSA